MNFKGPGDPEGEDVQAAIEQEKTAIEDVKNAYKAKKLEKKRGKNCGNKQKNKKLQKIAI